MSTITKIGIAVLVVAIVMAGGAFLYLRSVSASKGLAGLNTTDAMAYRYVSMAEYYAEKDAASSPASSTSSFTMGSGYPLSGTGLDAASPLDATQFRYQALADFYAAHPQATR